MIQVIAEHSVDVSLLDIRRPVLDVGCRDFTFARWFAYRGHHVAAVDPDPTIDSPKHDLICFERVALVGKNPGRAWLKMTSDPQARHINSITVFGESIEVQTDTILSWDVEQWDVVKLDCEGSEYDILLNWPGPIARQITVEFHEHVETRPEKVYVDIMTHLGQWYDVVQHEKSKRHCLPPNYWDSLFVLRGA